MTAQENSPEASLTVSACPGYVLARFNHDLDMEVMLALRSDIDRLLPQIDKPIIVDLANVSFLDNGAVGMLTLFFHHAQKHGLSMLIVAAQPQPAAVLGMVGLSDHVPLYSSLEAAENALTARLKARE